MTQNQKPSSQVFIPIVAVSNNGRQGYVCISEDVVDRWVNAVGLTGGAVGMSIKCAKDRLSLSDAEFNALLPWIRDCFTARVISKDTSMIAPPDKALFEEFVKLKGMENSVVAKINQLTRIVNEVFLQNCDADKYKSALAAGTKEAGAATKSHR